MEMNRKSQHRDYPAPPHPSSMPAQTMKGPFPVANGHTGNPAQPEGEKSQESGTVTSNTTIPEDEAITMDPKPEEDEGPRKRRFGGVMDRFHKKKDSNTVMERTATGQSLRPRQMFTVTGQLRATLLNSPINVLLIMVPVGIGVHFTKLNPIGVFVINFIAIIPLAAMLSYATEELALRTGETLGGLLNATFGQVEPAVWQRRLSS